MTETLVLGVMQNTQAGSLRDISSAVYTMNDRSLVAMNHMEFRIAHHVERALNEGTPVVALESTVIAHGLPYPINLQTALACEEAVRQNGATPATIGIVDGIPTVGLSVDEITHFATGKSPDGLQIEKVGLNNLAAVIVKRRWGGTTIASAMRLAHAVGIRVFSSGGIGGVHRGAGETFDISADLTVLGNTQLICVCAGAKAILDLPKTLQRLETLGVPVLGYETHEFPSFYSRQSGLPVDVSVHSCAEVWRLALQHWGSGLLSAILVCVPLPEEFALSAYDVEEAVSSALALAVAKGVTGKNVTPFVLAEIEKLTDGRSVEANQSLLINNARLAARIAADN